LNPKDCVGPAPRTLRQRANEQKRVANKHEHADRAGPNLPPKREKGALMQDPMLPAFILLLK